MGENKKVEDLVKKILENLKASGTEEVCGEALETSAQKIFNLLKKESFDEEIEQILANFNEKTMDLTKLQTQLIILIKRYLEKSKAYLLSKDKDLKIDEKRIMEDIVAASQYMMEQRIHIIKNAEQNLINSKDNYFNISNQSREDLKKIIKNFAVYEIYKVMNPKRIAGETRKQNFVNNMMIGGINRAQKYAGGNKSEIKQYSPEFIKKLENKRIQFNRSNRER